ncbi:hypothetical protein FOMPIDRAFT_1135091, partial [Fomitopsis schrenkii]
MTTAKKFNVSFAAVKLDKEMKRKLPIWYHLGATRKLRRLNNTKISDCLRDHHGVMVVADAMKVIRRGCYHAARTSQNDYIPEDCPCEHCTADRENGCAHPMKCCRMAEKLLAEVRPKWNPGEPSPRDGLSLTKRRQNINETSLEDGGTLTFDPSLTQRGDLEAAFRVFTDPSVHDEP